MLEDGFKTCQYYLKDHLGSTRLVVGEGSKEIERVESYAYHAYGEQITIDQSPTSKLRQKFTGKELDEDGGVGTVSLDLKITGFTSIDLQNYRARLILQYLDMSRPEIVPLYNQSLNQNELYFKNDMCFSDERSIDRITLTVSGVDPVIDYSVDINNVDRDESEVVHQGDSVCVSLEKSAAELQNRANYYTIANLGEAYCGISLDYFGKRYYDPDLGIWTSVDAARQFINPYRYTTNPIAFFDPSGFYDIHFIDQGNRPADNGTAGNTYTATVIVLKENATWFDYRDGKAILGTFKGSTYPNSVSNTNNSTAANTLNSGTYSYNNTNGHKGGTTQGLNIVDANAKRFASGTSPSGTAVTMENVNVHSGASDNGNYNSRGSAGCLTIDPADQASFFSLFDWSGKSGNTGSSTGTVTVKRDK